MRFLCYNRAILNRDGDIMALFGDKKDVVCPVKHVIGDPVLYLDGVGVNLYVYEKCIVIDRTAGGLFNAGNRTYKIIPLKYIIAMQLKSTGLTTGFLEFATYGHENTNMKGFDRVDDEDNINFRSEQSAKMAQEIVDYILPKIL